MLPNGNRVVGEKGRDAVVAAAHLDILRSSTAGCPAEERKNAKNKKIQDCLVDHDVCLFGVHGLLRDRGYISHE